MNILQTEWWTVGVPPEWWAQQEEDLIVIGDRDDVGSIEISTLRKTDGDFCVAEVENIAATNSDSSWVLASARCGEFSGCGTAYREDGEAVREWYLMNGAVLLHITHSCDAENQGLDDAAVDEILNTLAINNRTTEQQNNRTTEQQNNRTTEQQNNRTTEQQNNRTTEQQNNRTTEQQNNRTTEQQNNRTTEQQNNRTTEQQNNRTTEQQNNRTTQNEFRVFGLQRSGNHAITYWICAQCQGKLVYLNDVKPGKNVFLAHNGIVKNGGGLGKYCNFKVEPSITIGDFTFNIDEEKKGNLTEKDFLILSFEDTYLEKVLSEDMEKSRRNHIGECLNKYDILILRDAFNFFASRCAKWNQLTRTKDKQKLIELWKIYAKEYLGETGCLINNKVVVSYNSWFLDKEYRRMLANKLNLPFSYEELNPVVNKGGGSSFDGLKFKENPEKMKVTERWKNFVDDDFYRDIFQDKELVELSNRIFGKIPGTEVLYHHNKGTEV